ncbi:helix-turn-helix transcriptional regulator [Reticulibacter mediterranei]|uniref:Helix-turn-helix transcriptional regulator n=1 Tax=Reticulibacter mediterranei TaxID=2778369 RepID=A0A8J3MY56_9CHLR|nr:LuxR C-terminal-related transcriptional regulator [Reticulibacter mediterranei]GHO90547.1 helix-turn-helix transcriptional regulator [Reticulibacter mediterranei]
MPRRAAYTIVWSVEEDLYELHAPGDHQAWTREDERWFFWLKQCPSFAFQGRSGHITLLKERRRYGEGYWYAYRTCHRRTTKKYAGRSEHLTFARLEMLASALGIGASSFPQAGEQITESTQSGSSFLTPKILAPRLHGAHISREHLLARLNEGLARQLTLLCAPAGSGKTTLLSQWLAACDTSTDTDAVEPVAWLTLDASDNDPTRFWSYLIAACRIAWADFGQAALAQLQKRWQPSVEPASLEGVVTAFLNELASSSQQHILILEDYHLITATRIHETLSFLLDHQPATLHLVISTRSEPALPLPRLRARNELSEIRSTDLRFSLQETQEFLRLARAPHFSAAHLLSLDTRLQGWAAGLRLAALTLQKYTSGQEIGQFLAALTGSHRPVLDYFLAEVFEAQSPTLQRFLLLTSGLKQLTVSLCNAVTNRSDSEHVLHTLELANLFLEPSGGSERLYRYHPLFAEALQYEARQRLGEEEARSVLRRASLWYEQQEQWSEAVEKALQAQDSARAVQLLEQICERSSVPPTGDVSLLTHWFEQLPATMFQQRPRLCLYYATALLYSQNGASLSPSLLAQIEHLLLLVEEGLGGTGEGREQGRLFAMRGLMAWRQQDARKAQTFSERALACLEEDDLWHSIGLNVIGQIEFLAGHLDTARQCFLTVLARCAASNNQALKRAMIGRLSMICVEQGDLYQAASSMRQMLAEASQQKDLDDMCLTHLGLAWLSYLWNELPEAEQLAREALRIGEQLFLLSRRISAQFLLTLIQHAQGQPNTVQQCAALVQQLQEHEAPQLYRELAFWQASLCFLDGDLSAVKRWNDLRPQRLARPSLALHEREEMLLARLLLASDRQAEALDLLEPLLRDARAAKRTQSIMELQIVLACAHARTEQMHEAQDALREALELARAGKYIRPFLDEGEVMARLLRVTFTQVREKSLQAYLQTLLSAFVREPSASHFLAATLPGGPLTSRERQVLHLLAAGYSNPAIAQELVVSVHTVRTQVQSIYSKLNVHNRLQASELARLLHLLEPTKNHPPYHAVE